MSGQDISRRSKHGNGNEKDPKSSVNFQGGRAHSYGGSLSGHSSVIISENGSYFAQESPPSQPDLNIARRRWEGQDELIRITLKRYGLQGVLEESALSIDLDIYKDTMTEPPKWTGVYLIDIDSSSSRMVKGAGDWPIDMTKEPNRAAIRAFIGKLSDLRQGKGNYVFETAELGKLFDDDLQTPLLRPHSFAYCAASPITLASGRDDKMVTVGAAISFHASCDRSNQAGRIVRSVARTIEALLKDHFLALRREKEYAQQRAIVELMRMTQGQSGFSPTSSKTADKDRKSRSGHVDLEETFFDQAASSTARVLDANAVIIFDVSAFKFGPAIPTMLSRSKDSKGSQSCREPAHERADQRLRKFGFTDRADTDDETGGPPAGQVQLADPVSTADAVESLTDRGEGETSETGRQSNSENICSYTSTLKPIPLLASFGENIAHFNYLDGKVSRPLVARFLATARATGIVGPSHAEGETSTSITLDPTPVEGSPLSGILPSGFGGLLASPVLESSGQPCYLLLCMFKDKPTPFEDTDRLFLEMIGGTLIASTLRIRSQAVDRAQIRLTQRMQHQLRTPLHTIVGFCESAGNMMQASAETRNLISSITLSAESLDSTISDIFDYSALADIKEPAAASTNSWSSTNFRGLFNIVSRAAIAAWRLHCLSRTWLQDDTLQIPPPPEIICTTGPGGWANLPEDKFNFDCESLTRIASKVVANALQATEFGLVTVNLGVRQPPVSQNERRNSFTINDLHLTVTDTGRGMSKDFLKQRIFRPFRDLDSFVEFGSGFSLSICSALMIRLGGRINVSSEIGKGSKFDFIFPLRGQAAPSAPTIKVRTSAMCSLDGPQSRDSFLAFCEKASQQYGATYLGDCRANPQLLEQADLVMIAGEATWKEDERAEIVKFLTSRPNRKSSQILLELPNRAFGDPPHSLKSELKQFWLDTLPAVQIYRPFALPDLEILQDIFTALSTGCAVHTPAFLAGKAKTAKDPSSQGRSEKQTTAEPSEDKLIVESKDIKADKRETDKAASRGEERFRCLVVEDNPLNARILVTLLRRAGIEYLEAADGIEAVDLFRQYRPQIILLDINMPRMNGFDAAIEMRKIESDDRHAKIVAVTALSSERDKLRGFDSGIDDWMTKPVRLAQLASDVQNWKQAIEEGAIRDGDDLRDALVE